MENYLEKIAKDAFFDELKKTAGIGEEIIGTFTDALIGASAGSTVGSFVAGSVPNKKMKNIENFFNTNAVDSKKYVKKRFPSINVITNKADLKKSNMGPIKKLILGKSVDYVEKGGKNAMYMPGTNSIVVSKKVNPKVIGHEIGHYIDLKDKGFIKRMVGNMPMFGQYKSEAAAWDKAPFKESLKERFLPGLRKKNIALKDAALSSYSRLRTGSRVGGAIGAAGGLAVSPNARKLITRILSKGRA